MKYFLSILLTIIIILDSQSQNSPDFFKAIPVVDKDTPEWARLMYSENPNVVEVEDLFKLYYENNEFVKTIHTQNHKHWIMMVESLLDQNGFIKQHDKSQEDHDNKELREKYQQRNSIKIPGSDIGWVPMGPFETYSNTDPQAISWHKNIYSIDQSSSDPDILISGTEAGGVYKTTDKGANWSLISKGEVFAEVNSAVKIHPSNPDIFLVSSNKRIYHTTDGGSSWQERHFTNGEGNEFEFSPSDNDVIFHTSTTGLFKSIDGGITWSEIYLESCWDIDFHPTDNSVAYLLKSNYDAKRSEIFRSDDAGVSWMLKDNGYYIPSDYSNASNYGGKIAVTPSSPDLVYVCLIGASKANDNGWIGIYKSTNKGDDWTNPTGQDGGPYGPINGDSDWNVAAYSSAGVQQGFFNFDLEASSTDPDKIWIGTIRLSESNDGGQTYQSIGAANSNRLDYIHADIQDLEVIGNDIWVASDGGVNYSNDELWSHVALNKGIQAAHFWGFNTGWNEDTYTGGKYHDGTSGWHENYGNGKAYNIGGVEEASGYVHPVESRKLLFRTNYASSNTTVKTIPSSFGNEIINHPDLPIRPNESYYVAERSGVYYDPRYANHMYVGLENKVYKSTNGGLSFDIIFTFPDENGVIYEMEISRSNPNVIYGVYNKLGGYWDSCELWKSIDGGLTWTKTTGDPYGNNRRFRISIHPEDENEVWICTPRGYNGGKVNYTSNGGTTWINKTTDVLDGEDLTDIMYQGGTNDIVYVVSQNGVLYWDVNSNDWSDFSTGLPLITRSLQVNPFYRDGELRLASRGRGVWARKMQDTLFTPVAQPITYSDTVFCSKDSVRFDCYSILKHKGASWDWSITPAPIFISSNSVRNPTVVFGFDGNYDVSLTVTDAQGNSNTRSVVNMVTVLNSCDVDSIVGNALTTFNDGDYFIAPKLNLSNVTHFTISAWIKPNGTQSGFAGIVTNGEWCAHCNTPMGLIFDYFGNKLYYRWPDGSGWGSNSGLTVPLDKWSYVAMVVTPDSVTLYMNEQQWVSYVTLSPANFPVLYVGMGHYSGYFKGNIDEVTIWNRALSQSEIRELRHLTKADIIDSEPGLIAYYQFNKLQGSTILDNAKDKHGVLIGGAALELSSAPVGPGKSIRDTIDNNGTYYFTDAGLEIDFGNLNPNGEIVVSRLNVYPNSLPNSNPSFKNYWIVNNYGTSNFDALNSIKFKASLAIPYGNSTNARLHGRFANGHLDNWTEFCGADNFLGDTYNYSNSCNITNTYQFFIQSQNENVIIKRTINLTVFLEGPFNGTDMDIITANEPPLNQPFNKAPWYYEGTETNNGVSDQVVDWLLMDIKEASDASTAAQTNPIERKAVLLLADGTITDAQGNDQINFEHEVTGDLYITIWHKNHLGIQSAFPLTKTDNYYSYDFSVSSGQGYGGSLAQKEVTTNIWGMIGGDGDQNGTIDTEDLIHWQVQSGQTGYQDTDFNIDGELNNQDKNDVWWYNIDKTQQIPLLNPWTCGEPFTDPRDDQSYTTVVINDQCWMQQNLNYDAGTYWCYDDDPANCDTYGKLYDWSTIMDGSTSSNAVPSGTQGICPVGWHVPSDAEWCNLTQFIDPTVDCDVVDWSGTDAGTKMKSIGSWTTATNTSDFSALPGGYLYNGNFYNVGTYATFWSSTDSDGINSWARALSDSQSNVRRDDYTMTNGFSLRCVKD